MIITYNIFVQAIGVIGIISSIISFQCKRHKPLMIFRTGNELFFALQYFLLGGIHGHGNEFNRMCAKCYFCGNG